MTTQLYARKLLAVILITTFGCSSQNAVSTAPLAQNKIIAKSPSPDRPAVIVSRLKAAGLRDTLGGRGWNPSRTGDGSWIAILITPFGDNEVSFFVESNRRRSADLFELEAEFHTPGAYKTEVMALFRKCVFELYPSTSESLSNAIDNGTSWTDGRWSLRRIRYGGAASASGGYGIMFRWSKNN